MKHCVTYITAAVLILTGSIQAGITLDDAKENELFAHDKYLQSSLSLVKLFPESHNPQEAISIDQIADGTRAMADNIAYFPEGLVGEELIYDFFYLYINSPWQPDTIFGNRITGKQHAKNVTLPVYSYSIAGILVTQLSN